MSIPQGKSAALSRNGTDVVICAALRTPLTKARKGGLKDTTPEHMLSHVFQAIIKQTGIDPKAVEDIGVGNVLPPGGGATVARMAALHAGFPNTTSVFTVNRQCSSGLTSINHIANEIATGQISIGIGAGVESMSLQYGAGAMPEKMSEDVLSNQEAADCLVPMGITSENVAKKFKVSREKQDAFSASSHAKAVAAQKAGKFKSEIVPVKTKWADPKSGDEKDIVVDADDGLREGVTAESLGKLKPAFSKDGTTTAGSASQVTDGAAAVLLARRSVAQKLGLPIIGKWVAGTVVGVPPAIMGIGPAVAIPKVLAMTGLKVADVDVFEINEAFASQAVYSVEVTGVPIEKVNPVGGAIALGHPLGATGSRQVATGLAELKRTGGKILVTSMCIGSGMGMAAVFVSEQ